MWFFRYQPKRNINHMAKKITKKEKEWINEELQNLKDPKHFRLKDTIEKNQTSLI